MAKRKYHRKIYKKGSRRRKILFLIEFLAVSFLLSVSAILGLFFYYSKDLPRPEKFMEKSFIQSSKIYDRTGKILLYELYGEGKRRLVSLDKIPDYLKEAVIVTEDANFYHHFGLDPKGIIRSILIDLKIKKPVYGGSTITQQLIRSTFFSNEKSIKRKIREIILSLELDRRYPKNKILEWYLNQVYFGQNAYGVEAASETYFGKTVSELSLTESAVLASLIRAPSYLSPYGKHKDELMARKNYVLERMKKFGYITPQQAEKAKKQKINFVEKQIKIKAPYLTLWVKSILEKKYGKKFLQEEGLNIYTSLDYHLQKIAEKTVKEGIERNKKYKAYNAGLVAIDPRTGQILALTVGTGNYYADPYPKDCIEGKTCLFDPKFNIVIGTKENPGRQPGSAFKPFVYVTAFKKGYDDKTVLKDEETNFGVWGKKEYIPQNYDGKFRGPITLRESLAQSINIPSIKVLYLAGLKDKVENVEEIDTNDFRGKEKILLEGLKESIKTAKSMGITTLNKPISFYGPSLVLGGGEVKLLDITSAYGVFATEGLQVPPSPILRIENQEGKIIEESKKTPKRVLDKKPAKIINDILSDNEARAPMFGKNSPLYFKNCNVAAKTGTTQNFRDAWTIGYTPSLVVGVWVGNNNNTSMEKKPAVSLAGPIFHDFMNKALEYLKNNKNTSKLP